MASLSGLGDWLSPDDVEKLAEKPADHTIGSKLSDYVLPKCPVDQLVASRNVRISISSSLGDISEASKRHGKLFNWRRPTYSLQEETLNCVVSPGVDYVYHYARLIATASDILGVRITMEIQQPTPENSYEFMDRWVPRNLPQCDVIVLGYVERVLTEEEGQWHYDQGFGWRCVTVNGLRVLVLGCEFSYWGDLAGSLVSVLASRRIASWVIYVGKLGTLNVKDVPNRHVATGCSSLVEKTAVTWQSKLALDNVNQDIVLVNRRHITTPSIIDETCLWYAQYSKSYDLVDPEIGRMAAAALSVGIDYDYLHVVSDNLSGHHENGLYGERKAGVLADRKACLEVISGILRRSIGNAN